MREDPLLTTVSEGLHSHSVQQNWTTIKDTISDLMTKYRPIPKKNATTRHNLPWFDTKLRRMNRKLQRLYSRQGEVSRR